MVFVLSLIDLVVPVPLLPWTQMYWQYVGVSMILLVALCTAYYVRMAVTCPWMVHILLLAAVATLALI